MTTPIWSLGVSRYLLGPFDPQVRSQAHEAVFGMTARLLRRRQVEEITGLSRSSIYRLMRDREFLVPVRVGPAARWKASDFSAWLDSQPPAIGEFEPTNSTWTLPG